MKFETLKSEDGMYGLVGLHQLPKLIEKLGLHPSEETTQLTISKIATDLVKAVSDEMSGVVLEPQFGFPALADKAPAAGIAFEILEVRPEHPFPSVIQGWGVSETASNYACVLATVPYHPQVADAVERKKLIFELSDFCNYEKVEFILNLEMMGAGGGKLHPDELPDAQLAAVQEFRNAAAGLILDYPGSALSAATLTAELDVPWLVRSDDGQTYEQFKEVLRSALDSGSRGFLVSDPLWLEIIGLRRDDQSPDLDKISEFIAKDSRDRAIELMRIANEAKTNE